MNIYLRMSVIGLVLLVLGGVSFAQKGKTATTKPKSQKQVKPESQKQVKPKPMVVTVKEVSGTAHRLVVGKEKKWVPLKAGDKLDEMTVIRTGFRTKVVLTFADNSEVIIDRVTKMGIREFRKEGKVTRTTLGLKYGSLRATVKKADGPNDFRISTPTATAAARGSKLQIINSGDFGSEMKCSSGKWNVKKGSKRRNLVKGEGTNNRMVASIRIAKKKATPVLGDVTGGLSRKEVKFIMNYGNKGRGTLAKKLVKRPAPRPRTIKIISRSTSTPTLTPCVRVSGLNISIGE